MVAARPSARKLAFVAGAAVVVVAIAVWWISGLRSIENGSEPEADEAAEVRGLRSQIRALEAALTRIDREKDGEPEPQTSEPDERANEGPEVASATHLRALVRAYDAAATEKDRVLVLDRFTYAHSMYAEMTGDLQFLPFLRDVISTSESAALRKYAVIALHGIGRPEVVDLLQELLADLHAEVRFYAAEALPWVAGMERDRARRLLVGSLDHEDPEVRRIVALSLGVVQAEPASAEPMLRRLAVETRDEVLEALVFSIRRLLPGEGERRIRGLEGVERSRADRIESLLR